MTSQTGLKNGKSAAGFTLVELVLVMALLVVVLGVALPSLSGFFRARNLDSEARQFVSLARYGQSRAVAEGMPTILWISAPLRRYGLQLQPGFLATDSKAVEMILGEGLQIEVPRPASTPRLLAPQPSLPGLGNVPMIRFLPTGFIAETSPELIVIRQGTDGAIWIAPNATRLTYEIQTNVFNTVRR